MTTIDEKEIYRWFEVFREQAPEVELRCIRGRGDKPISGYFDNPTDIINAIRQYQSDYSIYFTINEIDKRYTQRSQWRRMVFGAPGTKDAEIKTRLFILIDIDPIRPEGICSSEDELRQARTLADKVQQYLCDQGFYRPIRIASGNGVHLYLPCLMNNTDENKSLVERFLKALDVMFSTDVCHIDTGVSNASRIARLPGCWNRKGSPLSQERPQRMCHFEFIPEEISINSKEYFAKVAQMYAEQEVPSPEGKTSAMVRDSSSFDLDSFLSRNGIEVLRIIKTQSGTRYILKECPFNPEHGATAAIFRNNDGMITFYCFHNSCQQYRWKDLRMKYEPDAYAHKDYQEYQAKSREYHHANDPFPIMPETPDKGSKWLDPDEISLFDPSKDIAIPTGFSGLDDMLGGGLMLTELTVLSGSNGSGKSTWLNQVVLNCVQRGTKCALWSGELIGSRLMYWLHLMAAGRGNVAPIVGRRNLYGVSSNVARQIDGWLKGNLFIYNNRYGSQWAQLKSDMKEAIEKKDVKLLVVDNLAAMTLGSGFDKYEQQRVFIGEAAQLAKDSGCHIIVVCHPRKSMAFLRKEDISGSSNLTDLADNVIIVHRVDKDFLVRAQDYYGPDDYMFSIFKSRGYDNALDVSKTRFSASDKSLVGLYFEQDTRRMKNTKEESIIYGWREWGEPALDFTSQFDKNYDIDDLPF